VCARERLSCYVASTGRRLIGQRVRPRRGRLAYFRFALSSSLWPHRLREAYVSTLQYQSKQLRSIQVISRRSRVMVHGFLLGEIYLKTIRRQHLPCTKSRFNCRQDTPELTDTLINFVQPRFCCYVGKSSVSLVATFIVQVQFVQAASTPTGAHFKRPNPALRYSLPCS
jgi:hypothetical protein